MAEEDVGRAGGQGQNVGAIQQGLARLQASCAGCIGMLTTALSSMSLLRG